MGRKTNLEKGLLKGLKEAVEAYEIKPRKGYMDMTDFMHHIGIGNDPQHSLVFENIKSCQKHRPCSKECGIVMVEVRFIKFVKKGKL